MIRVFLVHDDSPTREHLREILGVAADVTVVGHAAHADRALAAIRVEPPDVIVMGLVPRDVDSQEPAEQQHADTPLIVFAPSPACADAGRLLYDHAVGYVCPRAAELDLLAAVRAVHAGGGYICPRLADALKHVHPEEHKTDQRLSRLTRRELELLRQLAAGNPNREIARALGLSPKTVSTHRKHILDKLGLHSNVDLARLAFEHGLLDP